MAEIKRVSNDDLYNFPSRNWSLPRSPYLSALLKRENRKLNTLIRFMEQRRIVVFGAARVGKSSIIRQFLFDDFKKKYSKTVEDFYVVQYNLINDASLTLEIVDTAGYYEFPAMRQLAISTGDAFLLVYAVNDANSWDRIHLLRAEIVKLRGDKIPIVIAANKYDEDEIEQIVSRDLVKKTAQEWKCGFIECSAKENKKIVKTFERVLIQMKIQYDLKEAVNRRRQSFPMYGSSRLNQASANACTIC